MMGGLLFHGKVEHLPLRATSSSTRLNSGGRHRDEEGRLLLLLVVAAFRVLFVLGMVGKEGTVVAVVVASADRGDGLPPLLTAVPFITAVVVVPSSVEKSFCFFRNGSKTEADVSLVAEGEDDKVGGFVEDVEVDGDDIMVDDTIVVDVVYVSYGPLRTPCRTMYLTNIEMNCENGK
mmetsp:Transcript_20605/g.30097  ORF Transcript_20605/g.30097 Transcript_20605/m.30097 type:complete len:177 (-) Transcript_20605:361-891(-)